MLNAVYIRQTRLVPYADAIVSGRKTIETHTRNTLGRFVGQRVLIIRTMDGHKPEVIGSVRIISACRRTQECLNELRNQTLIPPGSRFDSGPEGKWCYRLAEPVEYEEALPLARFDILKKTRTFCELKGAESHVRLETVCVPARL